MSSQSWYCFTKKCCTAFSILLYIFCLGYSFNSIGQNSYNSDDGKTFYGALILGLNFAQVDDGDNLSGYDKVGLNAGGIVCVHFTQKFGASIELLYTQKGSSFVNQSSSYALGSYFEQYTLKLNYIEVPVLLHLFSGKYDFEGGFSYGRLISSNESIFADPPVIIDPVINSFNKTDIEAVVGLSYNFYHNWYANLRIQYSLAEIRPWERLPAGYFFDGQFNNLFSLRLIRRL